MWHEARKQERKIRVMMVDYKRRADRRRQFYEQIKQDPAQFVRIYGRQCKIHWEPSVALSAEGPQTMMPWRGDENIIIDRFDVRSHLDYYVEPDQSSAELTEAEAEEERRCNYERYRILVQNDVAGVSEDLCLRQIYLDELYGSLSTRKNEDKKKNSENKAAIGFTYEDSTPVEDSKTKATMEEDDNSDFEEVDLDNIVDIYNLSLDEIALLNQASLKYGMEGNDFYYNLEIDKDEAEALRLAKIMEEEKAQFSGRKSRRERRAFKERRLKDRPTSPPVYAARESPKYEPYDKGRSTSRSKSRSPEHTEEFSFITSFGGDGDEAGVVQGPTLPPHLLPKGVRTKSHSTRSKRSRERSNSCEPSERVTSKSSGRIGHLRGMRHRSSRSSSHSRSKSRSRSRHRSYSRSPLRRRGRYGHSRSRSTSRGWRNRRRSRSWSRRSWSRGQRSWSRGRRSWSRNRRSRSRGRHSRSRDKRSTSRSWRSRSHRSRSYSRSRSRSVKSFSRSRSYSSRSRTSSLSRSRSYSRSASKSGSRSPPPKPVQPVIKSYRRPSLSSSSSSSLSDSESQSDNDKQDGNKNTRVDKSLQLGKKDSLLNKSTKASVAEKMKLRMQKALKRQLKADMKARQEKEEKVLQQRQDREDELRAIAIQLRRREREKRHKEEAEVLRRSRSRSRSYTRSVPKSSHGSSRSRSRHRSRSPRHGRRESLPSSREMRHAEDGPRRRESGHSDWDDLRRRHTSDMGSRRSDRDNRDTRSYRETRDSRDSKNSYTSQRSSEYRGHQTHSSSESPHYKRSLPKLVDY